MVVDLTGPFVSTTSPLSTCPMTTWPCPHYPVHLRIAPSPTMICSLRNNRTFKKGRSLKQPKSSKSSPPNLLLASENDTIRYLKGFQFGGGSTSARSTSQKISKSCSWPQLSSRRRRARIPWLPAKTQSLTRRFWK